MELYASYSAVDAPLLCHVSNKIQFVQTNISSSP